MPCAALWLYCTGCSAMCRTVTYRPTFGSKRADKRRNWRKGFLKVTRNRNCYDFQNFAEMDSFEYRTLRAVQCLSGEGGNELSFRKFAAATWPSEVFFLFLLLWLLLCLCVYTEWIPLPMSRNKYYWGGRRGKECLFANLPKFVTVSLWLSCNFRRCSFLYSCVFLVSGKWYLPSIPWGTRHIVPFLNTQLRGETYFVSVNCDSVSYR